MKKLKYSLLLIALLSLSVQQLFAVPAYPYPVKIKQADGTTLSVVLRGDEFHHYYETEDGFLITKGEDGIFNYAQVSPDNKIVDTQVKANDLVFRSIQEKSFTAELNRNISFESQNKQMRAKRAIPNRQSVRKNAYPREGSPRSLVILVNFANLSYVTPNPQQAFTALLNEKGYSANGGTGSAKDYFIDNSKGKFSPQFDVVGPYTLPRNYEFYGKNDRNGYDENPVQMVIDACAAAKANGVDFTIYDTDNDGIVDNIFVYYAGHNEAENAGENTVWPHRWGIFPTSIYPDGNYSGNINNIIFDGKRVEDYACTSELRGSSGTNMAGIGTFAHEFGHVLGLADMYPTNGKSHHTLSEWSIMDYGAYLNRGRTPAGYTAFERLQLGYLEYTFLDNTPTNGTLHPLIESSHAYLLPSGRLQDLDLQSPQPAEFFLLENRQKKGWDTYLPGHGMLIYRINYNRTDWNNNSPNNDPNRMGVEILPADGLSNKQSLAGDPFPGTTGRTSFTPVSRNGIELSDKPISFIKEQNDIITFKYKGGVVLSINAQVKTFSSTLNNPTESQNITISAENLIHDVVLSFDKKDNFEIKTEGGSDWLKTVSLTPSNFANGPVTIQIRYNPTISSNKIDKETLNIHLNLSIAETVKLSGITPPQVNEAQNITYGSFVANWEKAAEASGYFLNVFDSTNDSLIVDNKWVTSNSDTIYNLVSNRDYYYQVQAKYLRKSTGDSQNITTLPSNAVTVRTLPYPHKETLRVAVQNNSNVKVFVPEEMINKETIQIFNISGQKIASVDANALIVDVSGLPKHHILILQLGERRVKVLIP